MPGASRLVNHLKAHAVPVAIATSTPRRNFERKMSGPNAISMRPSLQGAVPRASTARMEPTGLLRYFHDRLIGIRDVNFTFSVSLCYITLPTSFRL